MRAMFLTAAGAALVLGSAAFAQQPRLPGETGTPADIVTVPVGTAGAVGAAAAGTAGAIVTAPMTPVEGRSGGPAYINGDYQHRNEAAAPPGGVSETGRKSGVAENPKDTGQ